MKGTAVGITGLCFSVLRMRSGNFFLALEGFAGRENWHGTTNGAGYPFRGCKYDKMTLFENADSDNMAAAQNKTMPKWHKPRAKIHWHKT